MAETVNKCLRVMRLLARRADGNVSTVFAIAAVPLILAAGSAIDYVRGSRAQTDLQVAVDGAALAIATSSVTNNAERMQIGYSYFANNFIDSALKDAKPTIKIDGDVVTVSANFDYPTSFMALAGIDTMKISGYSQVDGGNDRSAEVVMVLDYSKSMTKNNKYTRMRDAASRMIDSLAAAKKKASLKVGLVPFSAMVRTSMAAEYVSQPSATATWTGCTQDRQYPWNVGVKTPDGSAEGKWGYLDSNNENASPRDCDAYAAANLDMVPLTDDMASVKDKLAAMQPVGNTNIPLGVEFGWNLLDPDAPFTEGAAYADDTNKKFLVLLTDGVQTSRQWGTTGIRSVTNGNDNLVTLCGNLAKKGITMYAIAYDVTDAKVTDLLKKCAGNNYFEASTSGNEIDTVFKAITQRIKRNTLRLAR
ncbi:MAG: hypothetical protein HY245_01990 [Rhizobiales bacterium]|nr:hypothetical protein [Hyphomicrobiales bacterium]MBI3672199.1 hypothetical protein [Hyphomicrobiales bacterium]